VVVVLEHHSATRSNRSHPGLDDCQTSEVGVSREKAVGQVSPEGKSRSPPCRKRAGVFPSSPCPRESGARKVVGYLYVRRSSRGQLMVRIARQNQGGMRALGESPYFAMAMTPPPQFFH